MRALRTGLGRKLRAGRQPFETWRSRDFRALDRGFFRVWGSRDFRVLDSFQDVLHSRFGESFGEKAGAVRTLGALQRFDDVIHCLFVVQLRSAVKIGWNLANEV